MSEENVPKLRLKPKLAAEPAIVPPLPTAAPSPAAPAPEEQAEAAPTEPKTVRLKPKLGAAPSLFPPPRAEPAAPFEPGPVLVDPSMMIGGLPPAAEPESVPAIEKPESKFSLKPKGGAGAFPPPFPPTDSEPSSSQTPIPAPDYVEAEEFGSDAVVGGPRPVTSRPFPPPPGNFPPPPSAGGRPQPPWAQSGGTAPKKKNFLLIGGGVVVVLLVLGGLFFAYQKFVTPPKSAPKAPPVAAPKVQEIVVAPVEKVPEVSASTKEVVAESSTATTPIAPSAKTVSVPTPEPVEVAPPPPPPSTAFRAWVEAVRIGGARGGANSRVFIGGTAYAAGEVVNSPLGIVFDTYNVETRHVVFKDKTGATVEKRN